MVDNFVMALAGAGGNGGVIEGGSVTDSEFVLSFLSFDDIIETVDILTSSFAGVIRLLSLSVIPGYEVTVLEVLLGSFLGIFLVATLFKWLPSLIP